MSRHAIAGAPLTATSHLIPVVGDASALSVRKQPLAPVTKICLEFCGLTSTCALWKFLPPSQFAKESPPCHQGWLSGGTVPVLMVADPVRSMTVPTAPVAGFTVTCTTLVWPVDPVAVLLPHAATTATWLLSLW